MGNRLWRQYDDGSTQTNRTYAVDIVGKLPEILMEINDSGTAQKRYFYANSQVMGLEV